MKLTYFQIDAFTDKIFSGNPAGVCPLDEWLANDVMQKIALENNLSETAFFVPKEDSYQLRWFTPTKEVDLCGHATLASAWVIFNQLNSALEEIQFSTRSGILTVHRQKQKLVMDFPASNLISVKTPKTLIEGLGIIPIESFFSVDYTQSVWDLGVRALHFLRMTRRDDAT